MDIFSKNLKRLRQLKNISQRKLAEDTNLSERGIQNYESGIRSPQINALIVLANYFNVTIDELVGRDELNMNHNYQNYLSDKEQQLLKAYRSKQNLQEAVDLILGINK